MTVGDMLPWIMTKERSIVLIVIYFIGFLHFPVNSLTNISEML